MKKIIIALLTFTIFLSTSIHSFAEVNKAEYLTKRRTLTIDTIHYADEVLKGKLFVSPSYPLYTPDKPITWKENPYKIPSWRLYYQSMDVLSYLTSAYELTNNDKYLSYGLGLIKSFWKLNNDPTRPTDIYTYESHVLANRTNNIMYFYHYYINSPIVNDKDKSYIKTVLRKHGVVLNDPKYYNFKTNHGIFEDRALIELAVYFPEFTTSAEWRKTAIFRTKQHMLSDFTQEGLHKEHSPLYFLLVMDLIEDINKIAKDAELTQLILKGQNAFSKLVLSDFRLPGIGDSDYAKAPIVNSYSVLDPEFEYVITRGAQGKQPELVSNVSNSVVVIRDGWGDNTSSWVYQASNFSKAHKHADDLSVIFSQNGKDILIDSGKYNYNTREAVQKYLRTTLAHNVVTVDGKSYPVSMDNVGKSKISNVIDSPESVIITGEHTIYSGVRVYRTMVYLKEKKVTLIQDEILSDVVHKTNQIFNIGQDISTKKIDNNNTVLINDSVMLKQHNPSILKEYLGQKDPIRGFASTTANIVFPIKQLDFESSGKNIQYFTSISTTPVTVNQFSLNEDQYSVLLSDGTTYNMTKPMTTPFVYEVSDKSVKVNGFTQGGANVKILYGSTTISNGKADETGNFMIELPKQIAGRKLTVIATSKNTLKNASTIITVKDKTAPIIPTIKIENQKTKLATGKTEKYVTVVMKLKNKTYTTKSNSIGNYYFKISAAKKGDSISIYAKDSHGNKSNVRTVKVK